MIIKATVTTNAADDPEGRSRVKLEAPTVWENSDESEDYYPSVGAQPLNVGDVVFVYIQDMDFANPLILGRCWDNNFSSNAAENADDLAGYSILYESVTGEGDDTKWSVAYTMGDQLIFLNSAGVRFAIEAATVTVAHEKYSVKIDGDGNMSVVTDGDITAQAAGETADQPVPFGQTLKDQLEALTKRVDAIIKAGSDAFTQGASGAKPDQSGAAAMAAAGAAWASGTNSPKEDWSEILNTSVTTAGKK